MDLTGEPWETSLVINGRCGCRTPGFWYRSERANLVGLVSIRLLGVRELLSLSVGKSLELSFCGCSYLWSILGGSGLQDLLKYPI